MIYFRDANLLTRGFSPFFPKKGKKFTTAMRKSGVEAKQFLKTIESLKEFKIPQVYVILDVNLDHVHVHVNSPSQHAQSHTIQVIDQHVVVQRNSEPQQSYDSIPLDVEDEIEGGDDEVCDREQDVNVRGVRDVRVESEAVFDEEGLNPSDPSSDESDENDDNEFPYEVNELRVINKKLRTDAYTSREIKILSGFNRKNVDTFVNNRRQDCLNVHNMPAESQILMFLMRYRKGMPLDDLGIEFCVQTATVVRIVDNLMYKEVKNCQCIPYILDEVYQAQEIQQCFDLMIRETPPFIEALVSKLIDPTGKGRIAVPIYGDGTYFYFEEMNIKL